MTKKPNIATHYTSSSQNWHEHCSYCYKGNSVNVLQYYVFVSFSTKM